MSPAEELDLIPGDSQFSDIQCRICFEGETFEVLISPCRCRGSMALVHSACLERWVLLTQVFKCQICNYTYNTIREPRTMEEFINGAVETLSFRNIFELIGESVPPKQLFASQAASYVFFLDYLPGKMPDSLNQLKLVALFLILLHHFIIIRYFTLAFRDHWKNNWKEANRRIRFLEVSCPSKNKIK